MQREDAGQVVDLLIGGSSERRRQVDGHARGQALRQLVVRLDGTGSLATGEVVDVRGHLARDAHVRAAGGHQGDPSRGRLGLADDVLRQRTIAIRDRPGARVEAIGHSRRIATAEVPGGDVVRVVTLVPHRLGTGVTTERGLVDHVGRNGAVRPMAAVGLDLEIALVRRHGPGVVGHGLAHLAAVGGVEGLARTRHLAADQVGHPPP